MEWCTILCGIIGITSTPNYSPEGVARLVVRALLRLEYRGYDSAGVAGIVDGEIVVRKARGKIEEVSRRLGFDKIRSYCMIGHTRWATHGVPSDRNAHPHTDCRGWFAVVHNGILENHAELRRKLERKGHVFSSDTDTEVLPHLVEDYYVVLGNVMSAFEKALGLIRGSYAFAMISVHEPDKIFFAKNKNPLVVGIGKGFNAVASDIAAIIELTRRVVVLRDGWYGYVSPHDIVIYDERGEPVDWRKYVITVEWSVEDASKSGYPHYMLKEIMEQPVALQNTLAGIRRDKAVEKAINILLDAEKIYVTAAGTSYHAGLYYASLASILSSTLVHPFIASEYELYVKTINEGDAVIAISQSGETMDTLNAIREARKQGAKIIAVSNVVESSIPRESDTTIYTRAGPEIGVAATKTFTSQTLALYWLSVHYALAKGTINQSEAKELLRRAEEAPQLIRRAIEISKPLAEKLAGDLSRAGSMYVLSRGIGVPVAMEGALKIKEISYIHAEAYPAGESKHGPIALIEKGFPVIFIVPNDPRLVYLLMGNIEEMKSRGALTIGVLSENTCRECKLDIRIETPYADKLLVPFTHTPFMQLLSYYIAVNKGYDPDKPRNLAKTVTVE